MRRLALLVFLFPVPAFAQRTIVSGTITDPNGVPYSNASLTSTLVLPVGSLGAYLNGAQVAGSVGPVQLDATGSFLMQLADNGVVQCANTQGQIVACSPPTQWTFTITESPGIPPPAGTGPQTCSATLTITGTSQTVSSQLSANCLALTRSNGSASTFNGKNFGAKGDVQVANGNCTLNSGSPNMVCPGATFTTIGDVRKRANCGLSLGSATFFPLGSTIVSVANPTTAVLSANATGNTVSATCAWGTIDDVAINKAVAAWLAAIRAANNQGPGFLGSIAPSPVLYFPSGGYFYCGTTNNSMVNIPATVGGAAIIGDPQNTSWLVSCDSPANPGALGFFINQQSGGKNLQIKNLSFTSVLFPEGGSNAVILSGQHMTENLYFTDWNGAAPFFTTGSGYNLNLVVDRSGQATSPGVQCVGCQDEFHFGGSSNNGAGPNTLVSSTVGLNLGNGPRFFNWLNDEGGCSGGCFRVTNSADVWILASALFGTGTGALVVDGNSFVHLEGGIVGVFGNDNNEPGLVINTGGTVQSSDVRYVSTGTANCINNSGVFNDNGGNTCESQFPIASGTSTGTTAVLTLTNVGAAVNANCSVGDALMVQGAAISGYDGYYPAGATSGITAVTATTLTYTTTGSNLGALGAGGTAYCRNLQTYTGNLPKALLNNPVPNTCVITGTFAATTTSAPMCNFKAQSATNISFIKASSTTTTACTVAPVVTITDGTSSVTLTITTAKSQWDSSVDVSSGVGATIFKPNGGTFIPNAIVVTNTAGTCTTPPTNFAVSYNIAPILSN